MSVVISSSFVLTEGFALSANNPLVGYDNLVTIGNIEASSEDANHPATNLANPSTYLRWRGVEGSPAGHTIEVAISRVDPVDYVGIAGHNFGSAQIPITIEGLTEEGSPDTWTELVGEVLLANDGPVLFRFDPTSLIGLRIVLGEGSELPTAAVVYVGALLVLQRKIYVGHSPITLNRKTNVVTGRSESGNYLGRIVIGETTETAVDLQNITPAFYRTYMDPWISASKETPFFFAWRPQSYPFEVGYVWAMNDPTPANQRPNGMMQVSMQMQGIVE